MLQDEQVGFIGSGTMAEAMAKGLLSRAGVAPTHISAAGPRPERALELAKRYGIEAGTDNGVAASRASLVILSVKPQVLPAVAADLAGRIPPNALLVSIVAGTSLAELGRAFGHRRVVRAMPNTPARIGLGMTVWTASHEVVARERELARTLFAAFGEEEYVDDESHLDRATALSGTGPAYLFLVMEALVDAGVRIGFSRRLAERLVLQTAMGSAAYCLESGVHPVILRNQVTSPGGTSAEALYQLERGGLRTVLADAVQAAYRRAVELGRPAGAAWGRDGRPGGDGRPRSSLPPAETAEGARR